MGNEIECKLKQDYDGLQVTHNPVLVTPVNYLRNCTDGALVAHRYTYVPRCGTSQYCRTFVPLSVSFWNDLADLVFDGVGLVGFKSRANVFLLA